MSRAEVEVGVCCVCGESLSMSKAVRLAVAKSDNVKSFVCHPTCFASVAAPQFAALFRDTDGSSDS